MTPQAGSQARPSPPPAASPTRPGPEPPHRNASYSIDVELDTVRHVLTGREVITWRNPTRNATRELFLHLYWNAWRNSESTWMRERRLAGTAGELLDRREDEWASIDITALRLVGVGAAPPIDLTAALRFVAPDTGNAHDRTLAAITLPSPVGPEQTINVAVEWTARVPRTFARTGRLANYYFIAHWFPKVAVLEPTGWVAHEFHANTEFHADFGTYDVRLSVPEGWILGATGRARRTETRSGRTLHHYVQTDVHDFAWVTSPELVERRARFARPRLPTVDMRLLLQPEHVGQEQRHFAATEAALHYYGTWFGPYPYGHLTIVDPAWQSETDGMEYPTIFTARTRWIAPLRVATPEAVTIHEAGHQFWYGLVANNEVDHAWLDEGLNSFSDARVLAEVFEPDYYCTRYFGTFVPWVHRDLPLSRETWHNGLFRYRLAATRDPQSRPTWQYYPLTHASITYSKTALWLHTVERVVGWPLLQRILSTYFERWKFRHPKPEDFFAVVEEFTGTTLVEFLRQVHASSSVFDYAIERFASEPTRRGAASSAAGTFDTTVIVRRHGDATFPVDVLVEFENGERVREHWDGRERWRAFTYTRGSRAATATVDPDRVLLLDVNVTNNSRTLEPMAARAAAKWAWSWGAWLQDRLMTFAFVW